MTPEQRTELDTGMTVSVATAAAALGLSPNRCYILHREGRELAPGLSLIRVGERKLVCPAAPLRRLLGIDTEGSTT